jgi:hypothetical protein
MYFRSVNEFLGIYNWNRNKKWIKMQEVSRLHLAHGCSFLGQAAYTAW